MKVRIERVDELKNRQFNEFTSILSQNYDGLVVRSDTKITADVLDAGAGHVKVVGR